MSLSPFLFDGSEAGGTAGGDRSRPKAGAQGGANNIIRHVITNSRGSISSRQVHADSSTTVLIQGHRTVHPRSRIEADSRPGTEKAGLGGAMQMALSMRGSVILGKLRLGPQAARLGDIQDTGRLQGG